MSKHVVERDISFGTKEVYTLLLPKGAEILGIGFFAITPHLILLEDPAVEELESRTIICLADRIAYDFPPNKKYLGTVKVFGGNNHYFEWLDKEGI